jgi:hypothetical protein
MPEQRLSTGTGLLIAFEKRPLSKHVDGSYCPDGADLKNKLMGVMVYF